jgi:arabinoxylan arabinofuranohydrolase
LINNPAIDRSWAPTAAWKEINGRPQFFLYWCNGGNGIGVVMADSPTGPWRAPYQRLLIDRDTPNCADVLWLFDPGVFVDDNGHAYLFFGGGWENRTPPIPANNTGMARRVRLSAGMTGIIGTPETWHVPYLFEASDMKKIRGRYYFSYSTHYSMGGNPFGLGSYDIAYMMADYPLAMYPGEFTHPATVLTRAAHPDQLNSTDTNNHHAMFEFRGETYITYHTQKVGEAMGTYPEMQNRRMRSAFIDFMPINPDGTIPRVQMTRKGVDQDGYLNPFILNEAETIGIQGGIYTRPHPEAGNGMLVTSIDTGDWIALYGVDFGSTGATKFTARVRTPEAIDYTGAIELRLNPQGDGETGDNGNLTPTNTARIKDGEVIGHVLVKATPGNEGRFATVTINLDRTVTGVNDLVFVFYSSLGVRPETVIPDSRHKDGFEFDQWQFFR